MPAPDPYASLARWYEPATAPILKKARARLVQRCLDRGFARVLDVGCGTGLLVRDLCENGVRAVGMDVSPAMLLVASGRRGNPGRSPLVRGGVPFPFDRNAFDAVIFSLVLHESDDDPAAMLREALRVAPVCLALEWRMPERNLDIPLQAVVFAIERCAGARHYRRFRAFAKGGYLHGAVPRAGARVVAEESLMGGTMVLAEITAESVLP